MFCAFSEYGLARFGFEQQFFHYLSLIVVVMYSSCSGVGSRVVSIGSLHVVEAGWDWVRIPMGQLGGCFGGVSGHASSLSVRSQEIK